MRYSKTTLIALLSLFCAAHSAHADTAKADKQKMMDDIMRQAGLKTASEEKKTAEFKITPKTICRATIAALMQQPPAIIDAYAESKDGVVKTDYKKKGEYKTWFNRCKFSGNRVIWAIGTGRWRTHKMDSKVYYKASADKKNITIREVNYTGAQTFSKTYSATDF